MKRFGRAGAFALLAILILTTPLLFAADPAGHDHTQPGIQSADDLMEAIQANTPEKHLEIAAYYRAKAGDEKKQAEDHRKMSRAYLGSKVLYYQAMKEHCDKLVTLHEKLAGEYEALAAEHEAAAAKK